ncbi:MAG: hypothetical protein WCY60_10910 [Trueperaceae bacterium]
MSTGEAAPAPPTTPWQATMWTCSLCGHCNLTGEQCEACGVARRYLDDPPLDVPFTPRLTDLSSFWIGLMWGVAALGGTFALLSPTLRDTIGPVFLLLEVFAAGAAFVSSMFTAAWERIFNQIELQVPPHAAAGSVFQARLKLVPYSVVENVTVKFSLSDRFYQDKGNEVELKTKRLDANRVLQRGRLPGRRMTDLSAEFMAPFPMTKHTHMQAELNASFLSVLSLFVPSLKFSAKNVKEHGGYYVEAYVRVGLLSRRYHKRVFTYAIGNQVHIG